MTKKQELKNYMGGFLMGLEDEAIKQGKEILIHPEGPIQSKDYLVFTKEKIFILKPIKKKGPIKGPLIDAKKRDKLIKKHILKFELLKSVYQAHNLNIEICLIIFISETAFKIPVPHLIHFNQTGALLNQSQNLFEIYHNILGV